MLKQIGCLSFLVFFGMVGRAYAQYEISSESKIFYRNERTFAGSLVSNGWAANFRYAKRIDAFSSYIFDADLSTIRHPKEIKSQSPYIGGWGRSFVFGKINENLVFRSGIGYQKELYGKYDQGGISVRYFVTGGFSLAVLKPIYYKKVIGFDTNTYQVFTEKSPFDPDYMQSVYDIYEKEMFLVGINETTVKPGIFSRIGLCFEYSTEDRVINALEGGVQVEGFLGKLPIMATEDNRQLFLSLFASYRFGKVIDARRLQ